MKLRLKDNSVRLRLQRSEVARLQAEKTISAATLFPAGRALHYAIRIDPSVATVDVRFANDRIELLLPVARANEWFAPEKVTLAAELNLENGEKLAVLVEKDFKCLHTKAMDDENDSFDHPRAKANC